MPLQQWHNDVTLEFIEIYKREEAIWNPKHPGYKNKAEIRLAWNRVQEAMSALGIDCSIANLKRKRESMMTTFRIHSRKKKRNPNYKTCWFAFPALFSFLSEIYELEPNQRNREEYVTLSPGHEDIPRSSATKRSPSESPAYQPKYLKPNRNNTQTNNIETPSPTPFKNTERTVEMDESELYSKLLAKKLRRLNDDQREQAMHEIDNIVYKIKTHSSSQRKTKSPVFILADQGNDSYEEDGVHIKYQVQDDPIHDDEQ